MIPLNELAWEPERWQQELKTAFRSSKALLEYLGTEVAGACEVEDFPVLVPVGFADRMQPGNPNDPLLRQVLAVQDEHLTTPGFTQDPLQEQGLSRANRHQADERAALIQKYAHRALLITTHGCAINCRYCFRRHFPYAEHRERKLTGSLAHIRNSPDLHEIILSGGDPLLLNDTVLLALLEQLDAIPHVNGIRIHTRMTTVLPARITRKLTDTLTNMQTPVVLVSHVNHAQELSPQTAETFGRLRQTGVTLLNQSVLLAGINNTTETLVELSQALFAQGVLPYYLHMPDRVQGTAHFYVQDDEALNLFRQMQSLLPGYLVPRVVREVPDEPNKILLRDTESLHS